MNITIPETKVTRLYMSRENRITDVTPLSYSDTLREAEIKASEQLNALFNAVSNMDSSLEDYFSALYEYNQETTDETESGLQLCAFDLGDSWAAVQQELSRFAVLMGIDGNEEYNRRISG